MDEQMFNVGDDDPIARRVDAAATLLAGAQEQTGGVQKRALRLVDLIATSIEEHIARMHRSSSEAPVTYLGKPAEKGPFSKARPEDE